MTANASDVDMDVAPLPQRGFGTDIDFDSLIKSNRFLYRVYTPKERSPFADDTDPFFVAPKFDELVARSPIDPLNVKFYEPVVGSYAEVARHMEWTTRTSSCYVSTSFSFTWAIWEAVRRYHIGMKKDVEIAIIDSTALGGRAATAIQLLKKSSPEERTEQFWKWYRFSQDSQSVLVYGAVPRTAVLASIPLLQILRKMPSYFLRKDIQIISGNPLDQVAWDCTQRKHNYRQFCQEMTKVFMARSVDVRLRDSTAGAVRLALSFLRPFFHNVVQDDFDLAISYLRTLAVTISAWPGGWWVKDHPEVQEIVEVMVLSLGEELREKYSQQKQDEISRLQLVIDGLEQSIKTQQSSNYLAADDVEIDSDGDSEVEFEESDEPTLVNRIDNVPSTPRPSLHMSVAVLPRSPISFQTPITPPESPRRSLFVPTVTIPLGDITSASEFSFQLPKEESTQNEEVQSAKSPAVSNEPASPPATPPTVSPVFSPMQLPVIEEVEDAQKIDSVQEYQGDSAHYANADNVTSDAEEPMAEVVEWKNEDLAKPTIVDATPFDEQTVEEEEQRTKHEAEPSSDQETVRERDDIPSPTSPSQQWVVVRQLGSPFSSRRSSIVSTDTLCEPIEFPMKRLSTYSDSFEFVPPMPSLAGLSSRTISFSDHSPRMSFAFPSSMDIITPGDIVPLPPAPHNSEPVAASLPSTGSVSRSASLSSSTTSTDSSASNVFDVAFITPLPPSPTSSIVSLSSTLSRTSSSQSSAPRTLMDNDLPSSQVTLIIPPKPRISLLSPLLEQDIEDEEHESLRPARAGISSDTASFMVTSFLVGAFITLFLFSTQRRSMLYLT